MTQELPLAGLRVLEYGQYVAVPFAAMLLADLGADVVKVEPPQGDAWRRYAPFRDGESRYFYALNRNKRSVSLDLKSASGREMSRRLIESADALLHNCLPARAQRFGLDRDSVHAINPRCAVVAVSSFGSRGPDAERPGYDLIAQALSGLLLAHPQPGDRLPVRLGGLALADFTAGLLAAVSVLAGLLGRRDEAPEIEVSLLGASLALQAQRFVCVAGLDQPDGSAGCTGSQQLAEIAQAAAAEAELDPYYGAHQCADGFIALACLNAEQRLRVCRQFGLEDPYAANPQQPPADEDERRRRLAHVAAIEHGLAQLRVADAIHRLSMAGVPCGELRRLPQLFDDDQARVNGLVQTIHQPGVGSVDLLGSVFKVDGVAHAARCPAPALDAHAHEVLPTP
jgi:crotonobetainyl-CoA:carnitine CoA-transferase CaiB-like acyl-CoA transferase